MPDLEELADLDDEPIFVPQYQHHVTAIVVSHEGAVWLPAVLTQLSQQTRPPNAVVAVDTGSTDTSVTLLRQSLGDERVIEAGAEVSYSAAVDMGVAAAPQVGGDVIEWIWLLHDDSAPQDSCLERLLQAADTNTSVAILGPKILGWHDQRLLLEVGVSVTGSGRRYTGLERREHDQGQHDGFRDVLSVSSAGMLIRREVWDRLRGFNPNLPLFRNDLDLCWRAHRAGERVVVVTDAVLHHREASAHGRRAGVGRTHPQRSDRAAAAQVLLAQAPGWLRPLIALRLFVGGSVRSLASLIGKDITAAQDEVGALVSVARRPGRVRTSVKLVAETTTEPAGVVRPLRPRAGTQLRQALETVTGVITTSSAPATAISALDSGPVDDEAMYLEQSSGWARRAFLRPSVLLVLALTVVAVVATRGLWLGAGVLQGGSLLPAPDGAMDLWQLYTQAWHNVGTGSDVPAPPYLMVVFAVAAFLLGKAPLAVTVISLLSIPMAGWAAYFTLRGVIRSTPIRVWAAVAYAFLPAVTGAVSAGRIGTSIAAVVLPFAARSMVRICRRHGTMRRAAGTALLIAIVASAVPGLWLLFLVIAIVVVGWLRIQR